MTKIKICGLRRREDIETVNSLRPDYAGLIVNFPKSPRSISLEALARLTEGLDRESVPAVGVFVDQPQELIAGLLNSGVIDMAQLHGNEDGAYIRRLKALSEKPVIKAFTVRSRADVKRALESEADHILLDRGQGSGEVFDWELLDPGGELSERKWFLAGGLSEDNIKEAIERLRPFAVDLSSSVETDGFKDPRKIRAIIEKVRKIKEQSR